MYPNKQLLVIKAAVKHHEEIAHLKTKDEAGAAVDRVAAVVIMRKGEEDGSSD